MNPFISEANFIQSKDCNSKKVGSSVRVMGK